MNLLNNKYIPYKTKDIKMFKDGSNLIVENKASKSNFIILSKLFKFKRKNIVLEFNGDVISGSGCKLKMLNRKREILAEAPLNSKTVIDKQKIKYFIFIIEIPAFSKVTLSKFKYIERDEVKDFTDDFFKNNVLIVTPGYPSLDNRYQFAFVHTKVLEYLNLKYDVDVAIINNEDNKMIYSYEGVNVFKGSYFDLRELLSNKKYKNIIIHFFDENYGNVLDSVNISETNLYFYSHGADTLYRDYSKISSPYFKPIREITSKEEESFKLKDYYLKKYNKITNVKWIFVSKWAKERSEKLLGIKFNNAEIIPCYINNNIFSYKEKEPEKRYKIFLIKKFDDINSYANDIAVRTILELSKRPYFKKLEFNIYGDGSMFDTLLEPLRKFSNIKIHRGFLSHNEIKKVHDAHGIALMPSRYDTMGVSICEAASSGCVVVTSKVPAIQSYFPDKLNITCDIEDYKKYADVIERLINDEEEFLNLSKSISRIMTRKFGYNNTIKKEITMFKNQDKQSLIFKEILDDPVLTIIVPSYNVDKFLENGIISLLNQRNAHKLEVIIVNDGSKDKTKSIGQSLVKLTTQGKKSIVKLINKKNGGHGSTINVGIKKARGKYTKVMDGDDSLDSLALESLIDILESESADIVLTNYIEDYAEENIRNTVKLYDFLSQSVIYHFDDLCLEYYGFGKWGPILSCSTYKTDMLKKANFKLSEKMFYVDMELNINVAIAADTIKYYDLDIYRYLLGREGQSINKKSFMKNYKHHENVTINLINILNKNINKISDNKIIYIKDKLIYPMIATQYLICIEFFKSGDAFREFDKRLKEHGSFYNSKKITSKKIMFHRLTNGNFIRFNDALVNISNMFNGDEE